MTDSWFFALLLLLLLFTVQGIEQGPSLSCSPDIFLYFLLLYFETSSQTSKLLTLALNLRPSCFSLPGCWDYRPPASSCALSQVTWVLLPTVGPQSPLSLERLPSTPGEEPRLLPSRLHQGTRQLVTSPGGRPHGLPGVLSAPNLPAPSPPTLPPSGSPVAPHPTSCFQDLQSPHLCQDTHDHGTSRMRPPYPKGQVSSPTPIRTTCIPWMEWALTPHPTGAIDFPSIAQTSAAQRCFVPQGSAPCAPLDLKSG